MRKLLGVLGPVTSTIATLSGPVQSLLGMPASGGDRMARTSMACAPGVSVGGRRRHVIIAPVGVTSVQGENFTAGTVAVAPSMRYSNTTAVSGRGTVLGLVGLTCRTP